MRRFRTRTDQGGPPVSARLHRAVGKTVSLTKGCTEASGRVGNRTAGSWARLILLLGSVAVSTSCSSFRTEVGRPLPQTLTSLVEGETRVETVLHEHGPPHAVSALPDGFVFLYEYSRVSEFQWGLSLDFIRMPYFKIVKADSKLSESALLLTFDDEGLLRAQGSAAWREKLGGGGALQLIISALSLTDTSAYSPLADSLRWGRGALQRPPVTLNSAQNLRSGENGLQQRISPLYVGQATLEMSRPKPIKVRRKKSRR